MNLTELMKICGIGLAAAFSLVLLRELRREFTPMLTLGVGILVLLWVVPGLGDAVGFLRELDGRLDSAYVGTVVRGVGVTFLTGTACEISKSAGESTIAGYIELAGRTELMLMCLPLFRELLDMAVLV
ncbi:MAG: stage III sporulation AC/AD family protein [Clostridia bacterium]|nr:stage III sporulation AC/AD family protein [Clostridia bacterium]MBQ8370667.1 stage III sporulation AC/AD family protein [Clostridia bacterium]